MGGALPRGLVRLTVLLVVAALVVVVVVVARDVGQERASSSTRQDATVPETGAPWEPKRPLPERRSPEEEAAKRAARRFLAGYLPYSYGRGSASAIAAAAAPLREQLRRAPPRVPAGERTLEPRVVRLEVASSNGDLGMDLAVGVDDGRRRYSMFVTVRPAGGRWLVVAAS